MSNEKTFAELYNLDADKYMEIRVEQHRFSFRTLKRLNENKISNIAQLLKSTREDLLSIDGFGESCLREVESFCKKLVKDLIDDKPPKIHNTISTEYNNISILDMDFSKRLTNCLKRNNIHTVGEILNKTKSDFFSMRNFGQTCWDEINAFCKSIKNASNGEDNQQSVLNDFSGIDRVFFRKHFRELFQGDFTSVEKKEDISAYYDAVLKLSDAYDILGAEFVEQCLCNSPGVIAIIEMLCGFEQKNKRLKAVHELIGSLLPIHRKNKVIWYINGYTSDETLREKLLGFFGGESQTFENILRYDNEIIDRDFILLRDFILWCNFDIEQDIAKSIETMFPTEKALRTRMVISYRAQKKTLEYIGNVLDITRERVRQIEIKALAQFDKINKKQKLLSKIVAIRNGDSILSSDEIASYCGEYSELVLFLLKHTKSPLYTYDSRLEVFVVGNETLVEQAFSCMEEMPEIIDADLVGTRIQEICEIYELEREIVEKAFFDSYTRSGNVFHRSGLTRSTAYVTILEEYYPDGIEIYNPEVLKQFRELVLAKFGEKVISKNDRALSARIADVCVLCGKGLYKIKRPGYISKRLAKKIHDYIVNDDAQVFLMNSLFAIFHDELVAEGIDNKYFLQGVLRDLFDDEFMFRRDYVYTSRDTVSLYNGIVEFIIKHDTPVSKDSIYAKYPGITEIMVNFAASDSRVLNYFGEYFSAEKLNISETEKDYLRTVVSEATLKDSCHIKDVYSVVVSDRPEIFTRNYARYPFSAFSIVECIFAGEYEFSRPYIARKGCEIGRASERLREMIYSSDEFTVSEISEFSRDNHFQINSLLEYVNECNDEFLLVDDDTMMRIDRIGVDKSVACQVENIIAKAISKTTPVKELPIWAELPSINIPWTEWLIYSVIFKWGTKLLAATSSNQFRFSVPLVAPIDNYDPTAFKGIDKGDAVCSFAADDLSDMDSLLEDMMDDEFLNDF